VADLLGRGETLAEVEVVVYPPCSLGLLQALISPLKGYVAFVAFEAGVCIELGFLSQLTFNIDVAPLAPLMHHEVVHRLLRVAHVHQRVLTVHVTS